VTLRRLLSLSRRPVLGLLSPALVMAVSSWASAKEYVVASGGQDSATAGPWRTLQRALDTVAPGDVVLVEDGTYAGLACDGVSGAPDARIVFRARNRGGAKINQATSESTQDFVQFSSCSHITFDGFEVSGAPRSGIAILGNRDDGSDARGVTIQNCYSHNNGGTSSAGRHDGIFSGFALDLTIQDNRIDTTGEHGIYVSNAADNPVILRNDVSNTGANCVQINADLSTGGDGLISNWRIEGNKLRGCKGSAAINLDGAIRGVARNNVIFNAAKAGITLFQGDGAEASHDNVIVNNTVYDTSGSRAAIQVADGADNNTVFNNIFVSKAAAFEVQSVNGLVHDYNVISSFDGATASAHESTFASATLFLDAVAGDLRLSDLASPIAIDHGVAILGGAQAPAMDVLGGARPTGAAFDIGAYESGTMSPGGAAGAGGSPSAGGAGGGESAAPDDAGDTSMDGGCTVHAAATRSSPLRSSATSLAWIVASMLLVRLRRRAPSAG
jgi:parallel beta-helix repeat protein